MTSGSGPLVHSLAEAEVQALAAVYSERISAGQLLRQAGLEPERQPQGTSTAIEYWHAVNATLHQGALPDARRRILAIAAHAYPANQAFETGLAAAQHGELVSSPRRDTGQAPRADGELPTNGTVIAFDAVGYSDLNMLEQKQLRDGLRGIIEGALAEARIPPAPLRQDRGDGFLMVFSADTPKARIVADFVRELGITLNEYNATRNKLGRIRLRVSIHEGDILEHGTGWAGDTVVIAARLVDSTPIRQLLQQDPDAELALILSATLFDSVVARRLRGLSPGDFREVDVTVKKFSATAWLTLPGRPLPPAPTRPPASPTSSPAGAETPTTPAGTAARPANPSSPDDQGIPDVPGSTDVPVQADGAKWDFFVSALSTDKAWGDWITWYLQAQGYRVRHEAWDPAGTNYYLALQEGLEYSERTIVVLSRAYLASDAVGAAWGTAFGRDPGGRHRRLIPVRIEDCEPKALLGGIRYIDLVPFKEDPAGAQEHLIEQIRRSVEGGYRPVDPPPFPRAPA
ncbi:TIR domain-containing protein [Frankia sp. R43]|uniref:TIR domain-containing protein n=1 Tax=Frankia sp. R43 TaxID=269536 RepID=UPI0006CA5D4E|nr:TIR domain-containing protein [Frankia sp. R43]